MGKDAEEKIGRNARIRWFKADATQPLAEQVARGSLPANGYDIVMVNWTLDNATTPQGLKGMWVNVLSNLKPGGKFLGTRLQNIRAPYMSNGKYGNRFKDFENIPGGFKYTVECLTQPPFAWQTSAIESIHPVSNDIPHELGLNKFEVISPKETEVVQNNLDFWNDFVEDPFFIMVTARNS
jgi:hypothetical protein